MSAECSNGFWCFQLKDLINSLILFVTVAAIIWGPIVAIKISQSHENTREKLRRQYDIFHTLIKTRRMVLSQDHVSSLNLVQIEFYGETEIISSYKKYIENLSTRTPQEINIQQKFFRDREDLFFDLIHDMGKLLGFSLDKRELDKFAYVPQGWDNDETEIRAFRKLVIEVLTAKRPLPVTQFKPDIGDKFPPPPNQTLG